MTEDAIKESQGKCMQDKRLQVHRALSSRQSSCYTAGGVVCGADAGGGGVRCINCCRYGAATLCIDTHAGAGGGALLLPLPLVRCCRRRWQRSHVADRALYFFSADALWSFDSDEAAVLVAALAAMVVLTALARRRRSCNGCLQWCLKHAHCRHRFALCCVGCCAVGAGGIHATADAGRPVRPATPWEGKEQTDNQEEKINPEVPTEVRLLSESEGKGTGNI